MKDITSAKENIVPESYRIRESAGYDLRSVRYLSGENPRSRFRLENVLAIQLGHGNLNDFAAGNVILLKNTKDRRENIQ